MSLAGGAEMLCIVLLALIILDPQDLPKILRAVGRGVRTLRHLSYELMTLIEGMPDDRDPKDIRPPPTD